MKTKIPQDQLADINVTNIDPTATDDSTLRYGVGSKWFNTSSQAYFICEDATPSAAVWTATAGGGVSGVASVTGLDTDNTDPANPVVQIAVDGVTVTGDGTPGNPLVAATGGGGTVSGTGTNNHISRWNGTTDIQDSSVVIDDISGPSVTLHAEHQTVSNTDGLGLDVAGGNGNGTGNGGTMVIGGGLGGSVSGNGGNSVLRGGSAIAGNSNGGDAIIAAGIKSGSGVDGKVKIQNQNTNINAILDISQVISSDKTFTFPNQSGTLALAPVFSAGLTSRFMDTASGNQTITHGLGVAPKKVTIKAYSQYGQSILNSFGFYIPATTGVSSQFSSVDPAVNSLDGGDTSRIILMYADGLATNNQLATISVDATNITLAWIKTGTPSHINITILWEAES